MPDELFDELLPDLSGAELKVLLYVVRRTFGFKRERDAISLSQMLGGLRARDGRVLDRGVGLSKPTLLQALRSLAAKHVIQAERRRSAERGDEPTVYRVHLAEPETLEPPAVPDVTVPSYPVVNNVAQGVVTPFAPPVAKKPAPQETDRRQTDFDPSNGRGDPSRTDDSGRAGRFPGERTGNGRNQDVAPLSDAIAQWRRRRVDRAPHPIGLASTPSRASAEATSTEVRPATRTTGSSRPLHDDDAYQVLQVYMAEFARELGDRAPIRSSTTRLYNLFARSGLDLAAFVARIYAARSQVRERETAVGTYPANASGPPPVRHKVGYWFATVEDLLGFRGHATSGDDTGGVGTASPEPGAPGADRAP